VHCYLSQFSYKEIAYEKKLTEGTTRGDISVTKGILK
jgi:hypothetical protein